MQPAHVLSFWFGDPREDGTVDPGVQARWWKKDSGFDAEIRERFGALHERVAASALEAWAETPIGRLALIVVLDQFSRNLYRESPRAFAQDEHAQRLVEEGIERGHDRELATFERAFFYMPFMHAEDLTKQERGIACFESLLSSSPPALQEACRSFVHFAGLHRDIVARFGRFPHRNAALGRPTTDEEAAFLQTPGSSF